MENKFKQFIDLIQQLALETPKTSTLYEINQLTMEFKNDPQIVHYQKDFEQINKHMKLIQEKRFVWDLTMLTQLKNIFTKLCKIQSILEIKFLNLDFFIDNFPPEYFYNYINVGYGKIGGDKIYDEFTKVCSEMLLFFKNNYLLKDLAFLPRIHTETCYSLDPAYRQKIRQFNQNQKQIQFKYFNEQSNSFNLIDLISRSIELFFPNASWRWIGGRMYAHRETLEIILIMFEYGLWKRQYTNKMLTQIYSVSEVMYTLEDFIYKDCAAKRVGSAFAKSQRNLCAEIRALIAKIFTHLILYYLDEDVLNTLMYTDLKIYGDDLKINDFIQPKFNRQKILDLFQNSFFSKKKLYTYFSYVLITYIARYNKTNTGQDYIITSENMNKQLSVLFNFVSDINGDFFRNSLKSLKEENFAFYFLKQHNSIEPQIIQIKEQGIELINIFKNDIIQNQTFENIMLNFFQQTKKWFESIENIFIKMNKKKISSFFNLQNLKLNLLTLYQIPNITISILDLVPPADNFQDQLLNLRTDVFSKGIFILRKLCINNSWSQDQIFSQINLQHFKSVYDENTLQINYLFKDIIEENKSILIIEENEKLFIIIKQKYQILLTRFEDKLNTYMNENSDKIFEPDFLLNIYVFNKLFSSMFEVFCNKRSKYELVIAELNSIVVQKILKCFSDKLIKITSDPKFFENNYKNMLEFQNSILKWQNQELDTSQENIILQIVFTSFIDLIGRSTSKFFTEQVYNRIETIFEQHALEDFQYLIVDTKSLITFSKILRLYNLFNIFPNNNLLNNRLDHFYDLENEGREIHIQDKLMQPELLETLLKIGKVSLKNLKEQNKKSNNYKFFYCYYLPLIFKLYSGVLNLYVYKEHKSYQQAFEYLNNLAIEFQNIIGEIKRNLNGKIIQQNEKQKYKNHQFTNDFLQEYAEKLRNDYSCIYDEPEGTKLYKIRQKGYKLLLSIIEIYKYAPYKNKHIEQYVRYDDKNTKTMIFKTMQKTLHFNSLFREKNQKKFQQTLDYSKLNFQDPFVVKKFLSNYYKVTKTHFHENPEQNQCFTVLKSTDILRNNIEFYINYFLNEIAKMDIEYTSDLQQNIFYNQSYVSMLVMIDNLLQNSDKYRETFYQILIKKVDSTAQIQQQPLVAFKKIWKIHKDLFHICLFKPFLDKNWSNVYTLYYLISNFIQNLCEGNFVEFKLWFQNQDQITEKNNLSMFNYYFQMVEIAFSQTSVFKNKSTSIQLSDKPELFFLLNRITEGFTEFINGSNIYTQKLIYKYKINVWVGIILRPINDVDSLFYELKWHVLNYILGLTEGFDIDTLKFLATNFPIIKLYEHMIYLVKLLHARQQYFKKNGVQKNLILTQKQIDDHKIESDDILLDYYKKYQNTFSNHIVLNVVVNIYQLMRDISSKVIRYENFLLEKNFNINNIHKLNDKDKESVYIWKFIKQIIVDIEICHKTNDTTIDINNNNLINQNNNESKSDLRVFYFKKLPVCFFLTESMKRKFFDEVKIESLEEKHEQFFDSVQKFQIQVQDQQALYKKSRILFKLSTEFSFYLYKLFLYFISVIINILILLFFDNTLSNQNNFKGDKNKLIGLLSTLCIIFSLIFLLFWFLVKYPTIKKIKWIDFYLTNGKSQKPNLIQKFKVNIINSILRQQDFQSFFSYFVFTLLGLTFSQSMYTFSLLLIIHLNMLVYNVAMSFVQNLDKLFTTFMIILVVINSFSFIIAQNYRNKFKDDDIGNDSLVLCDTYFRCLMNTINLGLRGGGGISDYMFLKASYEKQGFFQRFFFDILFFILVNLILLGIFFGIIVDSFADYRDNMTKRNNDEQNVCFTCGLDKPNLEKIGISFNKHIKFHEIWNYFYYLMYLKWKPSNYYDGVDIYVNQMVEENYRDDWLPLMRTQNLDLNKQIIYQLTTLKFIKYCNQNLTQQIIMQQKFQKINFNIHCSIVSYLDYKEILQMLRVCKQYSKIVSRIVLLKMIDQNIEIDNFKEMNPKQLIQTFQFHFSKYLIMCPSISKFFDLEDPQNIIKKICLPQKIPIKNIEMTRNYLILIAQNKSIYLFHKTQFSQGFKILRKELTFNSMVQVDNVQKYQVAHNFYFLNPQKKLYVRVFNKNSIKDELTLQIQPDLKVFGERDVEILDFVVNDYYLCFRTVQDNYYFVKGAQRNVLNPIQLLSNEWHTFKLKIEQDVKQISLSQNHIFVLHQNGNLSYKNLQKLKFDDLIQKYTNNKFPEHITLQLEEFKALKNQKIYKIYNRKNFFLFQEKEERKKIKDFDSVELNDFITLIFKRKFQKIIKHYRITGQQLLQMDNESLKKLFGMHNIEISKLKDHIDIHKNIKHSRPKFYAFGYNPYKQFGISTHLNYLVQINLPNFDNNEDIVDVKIDERFTIIQTNYNRSFISLKIPQEQRNRKISMTGMKEQQNKKKKKKNQKIERQQKQQRNKKQYKKKGNRKGSNITLEEQDQDKEKKIYENGWLDIIDLIKMKNKQINIDKNIHYWSVQFVKDQFFMFYSKNINEQCIQYFDTAKQFLDFIKLYKNFDKDNILFFSDKDKVYHSYKIIIASEQKIKDTTVIKLKNNNKILWRMSNRYFDVKSFVNQKSFKFNYSL